MCVELSAMLRVDQLGQIFACTVWEYDLLSQRHEYKGSDMRLDGCMVNKFPLTTCMRTSMYMCASALTNLVMRTYQIF